MIIIKINKLSIYWQFSNQILIAACRRCGKESTKSHGQSQSEITTIHLSYGADLQLAQIRHMAELASWRGVPNLPQDYMDLLPVFPREKLTLTDFLGKGAFGEVCKTFYFVSKKSNPNDQVNVIPLVVVNSVIILINICQCNMTQKELKNQRVVFKTSW